MIHKALPTSARTIVSFLDVFAVPGNILNICRACFRDNTGFVSALVCQCQKP